MRERKVERKLELNRFLLIIFICFLTMQILTAGILGGYGISVIRKEAEDSMEYILNLYQANLNRTLKEADSDLQNILSSQSTLQMLNNRSNLYRWHASHDLLALLDAKRISAEGVDGYVISDSVYHGFLMSRSSNIGYDDMGQIQSYLENMDQTDNKQKNTGWISAQIGNKTYLLKCYNYGGVLIAAMISERKIQQILSYGQSGGKSVDFYITDSKKKIICSSSSRMEYGGILPETRQMFREKPVMGNAYYVAGSMQKISMLGLSAQFFLILGMLLVSLAFLLLFAKFINQEVIRPVRVLSDTSRKIHQGDLSNRPFFQCRNREMQELKQAYVTMLDTIIRLKVQEYERVIQMKDSELKYLHMQLKPHFFLNALSTINSMSYQNKNEEIREFVQIFSENIRYMFKVGLHTVPLAEEIDNVEKYLKMQRLLYTDSFYSYFEIPENVKTHPIPQMLLHTFAENIFKHVMDVNSFVTIFLQCSLEEHEGEMMLKVVLQNSGKYFPEEVLREINGDGESGWERKGIGLVHTKKILNIMYGKEHLLLLENEKPEGTKITIWIPPEVQKGVQLGDVGEEAGV